MSGRGVLCREMPLLPFLRPRGPATPQLDELLSNAPNGSVDDGWQHVSKLLQAAAAPAKPSELVGETAMLAAFRQAHPATIARRRLLKRPRMLTTLLTGKLAAVLAAAVVGATGAATAAYADALPDSVQNLAHHVIAAPPPHSHASATGREHGHQFGSSTSPTPTASPSASTTPTPTPTPAATPTATPSPTTSASPSASPTASSSGDTSAAFGLCNAWSNAVRHGLQDQVGFRSKLAGLAGGDANITSFCATVKHPGDDGSESSSPEPSATGEDDASASTGAEHHGKSGQQHGKGNPHNTPSPSVSASPSPTASS